MRKLTLWTIVLAGMAPVAVSLSANDDIAKWHDKLQVFRDDSSNWRLQWYEMEADTKVDFTNAEKSEHELELEGTLKAPYEIDAVGVSNRLRVNKAIDADGNDLFIKDSSRPRRKHRSGSYTAFHEKLGKVEVYNAKLRQNAYAIKTMDVSAKIVVAQERTKASLPAVVMEKPDLIHKDIKVRITGLKMSDRRELTLTAQVQKRWDGLKGAFVEAVYALDKDGKRIGGGRWTKGDPFGDNSKITYEFAVQKGQVHSSFEFVICTKYKTQVIDFEVTDIFQKAR
jgi:hypothetical protein